VIRARRPASRVVGDSPVARTVASHLPRRGGRTCRSGLLRGLSPQASPLSLRDRCRPRALAPPMGFSPLQGPPSMGNRFPGPSIAGSAEASPAAPLLPCPCPMRRPPPARRRETPPEWDRRNRSPVPTTEVVARAWRASAASANRCPCWRGATTRESLHPARCAPQTSLPRATFTAPRRGPWRWFRHAPRGGASHRSLSGAGVASPSRASASRRGARGRPRPLSSVAVGAGSCEARCRPSWGF
jgi:hypothetical protein